MELIIKRMNSKFINLRIYKSYATLTSFSLFLYNEYDLKINTKRLLEKKKKKDINTN